MFYISKTCHNRHALSGFTLAELLIALAILGVIATFTIPKILDSGSSSEFNAKAKEFASILSGAHQQLKLNGQLSAASTGADFKQYINYVRVDTTSQIDNIQTLTTTNCYAANSECLQLHNGGVIHYGTTVSFNSTDSTSALGIRFDPDGTYSGSATGSGKSVMIYIYYNGLIRDRGTIESGTCNSTGCATPNTAYNPPWFSWN